MSKDNTNVDKFWLFFKNIVHINVLSNFWYEGEWEKKSKITKHFQKEKNYSYLSWRALSDFFELVDELSMRELMDLLAKLITADIEVKFPEIIENYLIDNKEFVMKQEQEHDVVSHILEDVQEVYIELLDIIKYKIDEKKSLKELKDRLN